MYKTAAGKYFFITLFIIIIKDLTGRDDILYFTLVVDGVFLLGTCISCLLITRIQVRTLLFSCSIMPVILLMLMAACNYFKLTLFINLAWTKSILHTRGLHAEGNVKLIKRIFFIYVYLLAKPVTSFTWN